MDLITNSHQDSHPKLQHDYSIMIDKKMYSWDEQYITGAQIRALVGLDQSYGVWMKAQGPEDDPFIEDDEQIDLSLSGKEKFFTGKKKTTEG